MSGADGVGQRNLSKKQLSSDIITGSKIWKRIRKLKPYSRAAADIAGACLELWRSSVRGTIKTSKDPGECSEDVGLTAAPAAGF